jgi:hypothetical protein
VSPVSPVSPVRAAVRRAVPVASLLAALLAAPSSAAPGAPAAADEPPRTAPARALDTAQRVLTGEADATDPTMAMLALRHALADLDGADRADALRILARPDAATAGATTARRADSRRRLCDRHLCVRYRSDAGHPDHATRRQARRAFAAVQRSWQREVERLGFARPRRDAGARGDDRLDVYLLDLDNGLYGYAVPDTAAKRSSGYLVLDNDYAEFARPHDALRATAAHELFHVVQFGYDTYEDPWFMEATATWIEERVFDDVDDNRQYLPESQVHRPGVPLDTFAARHHYANWTFFEFLSSTRGARVVREAWERAGRRAYSVEALRGALAGRGGWVDTYRSFAAANTHPASTYPEGGTWGRPEPSRRVVLGSTTGSATGGVTLDHLAAGTWRAVPEAGLRTGWRLRVRVDGPGRATAPGVVLSVLRSDGTVRRTTLTLDDTGAGTATVPFDDAGVVDVSVTAVNASTRYRCGRGRYSCRGAAVDEDQRFALTLSAVAP